MGRLSDWWRKEGRGRSAPEEAALLGDGGRIRHAPFFGDGGRERLPLVDLRGGVPSAGVLVWWWGPREEGVGEDGAKGETKEGIQNKDGADEIGGICTARGRISLLRDEGRAVLGSPSSSQLGMSYSHLRINSFMTDSSSSSKGSDPVRRVYRITPSDQMSTSETQTPVRQQRLKRGNKLHSDSPSPK